MSNVTARFVAPELLALGPPPDLASIPYQTLLDQTLARTAEELAAAGIEWDVASLQANPAARLGRVAVYRDTLRRSAIHQAVTQTFLGSATGVMLDQRAADYGVLRRSIPQGATLAGQRPAEVPLAWVFDAAAGLWREDDESLRTQARLAWEALSVAGPPGAYVFHARAAHPMVQTAAIYGPESGHVQPGEVLVIPQSFAASGVPTPETIDSVADRLDAGLVIYGTGASRTRQVRDAQAIRPLGAFVIVKAPQPVPFYVSARIFVRPGPDRETIRRTAQDRLAAFLAAKKAVGVEIPRSAIIAALHVADAAGLPIVEEVELVWPLVDVVPLHDQIAVVSTISVEAVVR